MNDATERLRQVVAEWSNTRLALARLATERDGEWRLAIVQRRLALQGQLGTIGAAMDALGPGTAAWDEFKTCRKALSAVRTQLAMHQAEWPAVAIRPEDDGYLGSVAALRAANGTFAKAGDELLRRLAPPSANTMKEPL